MFKRTIAAFAALAVSVSGALAQEVKVGVVLPFTGIGANLLAYACLRSPHLASCFWISAH
jgi:hypothetical protein